MTESLIEDRPRPLQCYNSTKICFSLLPGTEKTTTHRPTRPIWNQYYLDTQLFECSPTMFRSVSARVLQRNDARVCGYIEGANLPCVSQRTQELTKEGAPGLFLPPPQSLRLSWLSPSIRGPNGWSFLCTPSWTDRANWRMSVSIKETLMSLCHEETGETWARALSPQEAMRIRSARLICGAEVVVEKGCCKDTDLPSLVCQIFT